MVNGYEFDSQTARNRVEAVLRPQPVPCDLGLWALIVGLARDLDHLLKETEGVPDDDIPPVEKGHEYGWTSMDGRPHYGVVKDVDSNVVYVECRYCQKECCTDLGVDEVAG